MSVASRREATLIFDLHVSPVLHAHLLGGRIWPRGYDETQLKNIRGFRGTWTFPQMGVTPNQPKL